MIKIKNKNPVSGQNTGKEDISEDNPGSEKQSGASELDVAQLKRLLKEGKLPSGRSPEEHQQFFEELRRSAEVLGHLHPVLRTQFGIAAGSSRLEADPNWPVRDVPVKNPYNYYRLMAGDNQREEKTNEWWKAVIILAANELVERGIPKGEISKKLYKDFPIGRARLLRLLPAEFKDLHQSNAAQASAQKRQAEAYRKLMEREKFEKERRRKEEEREAAMAMGKFVRYSDRFPSDVSDVRVSIEETTPTETENMIVSELVNVGIRYIPSAVFPYRDKSQEETAPHKVYVIPIYIERGKHAIGLDVEGSPASKDEEARSKYFKKRGISLVWIPKEFAVKYSDILAQIIRALI
ncbi:MAG: hypothetical protein ABSB40_05370 [Nitrososphaeria archaeon]|jgi:hypothetical protein